MLGVCLWGPALSCCFWTSGGAFLKSVTVSGLSLERSVSSGASPSRLIAGSFSLSHGLSLPEPAESLSQLSSPAFSCLRVPGNLWSVCNGKLRRVATVLQRDCGWAFSRSVFGDAGMPRELLLFCWLQLFPCLQRSLCWGLRISLDGSVVCLSAVAKLPWCFALFALAQGQAFLRDLWEGPWERDFPRSLGLVWKAENLGKMKECFWNAIYFKQETGFWCKCGILSAKRMLTSLCPC